MLDGCMGLQYGWMDRYGVHGEKGETLRVEGKNGGCHTPPPSPIVSVWLRGTFWGVSEQVSVICESDMSMSHTHPHTDRSVPSRLLFLVLSFPLRLLLRFRALSQPSQPAHFYHESSRRGNGRAKHGKQASARDVPVPFLAVTIGEQPASHSVAYG